MTCSELELTDVSNVVIASKTMLTLIVRVGVMGGMFRNVGITNSNDGIGLRFADGGVTASTHAVCVGNAPATPLGVGIWRGVGVLVGVSVGIGVGQMIGVAVAIVGQMIGVAVADGKGVLVDGSVAVADTPDVGMIVCNVGATVTPKTAHNLMVGSVINEKNR